MGGYQDWLRQGGSPRLLGVADSKSGKAELKSAVVPPVAAPAPAAAAPAAKKKLSYKEQRELEALPGQIEQAETQLAALSAEIARPAFYQRPSAEVTATLAKVETVQAGLDALLERWAELDD